MTIPTVFDTCTPRSDVLRGEIAEADFAADLASVVAGKGSAEYRDPVRFFADTYPTRGLKSLLGNVCRRLAGAGGEVAANFRLDTSYGGGKTHGLIALTHAARGLGTVPNISEFIDPSLLPEGRVRVAAFDGENADPANGRTMGDGVLAYTPWGEIACALAGRDGYERVRKSDETRIAPGAETLRELFGGEPTLILLDELSVYLRKVGRMGDAQDQLTAFLTSLFKAVEGAPNAALVYTLAIGKDGRASDAYSEENQFIADQMSEAESVSARKATLLNPTEEDETIQVLRRRLFERIDESSIAPAVEGYRALWAAHRESLAADAARPESAETFRASYPLHPEVLETLTGKTATLSNFQRVRGMLRLLARTIAHLWEARPADATAIHVHHIDPRARAYPPGDRHAASAERLRAGNRQRHRGRWCGEEGARAADRRRAPRGASAARHLCRPDCLHPHPGLQRAAQGGDGRRVALLDARSRHRHQLHRRGAQAVHRRIRVPRRSAGRTDALQYSYHLPVLRALPADG